MLIRIIFSYTIVLLPCEKVVLDLRAGTSAADYEDYELDRELRRKVRYRATRIEDSDRRLG